MLGRPLLADSEVAAATFSSHLEQFWDKERHSDRGWERIKLDELHTVVSLPATSPDGTQDRYYLRLGAEYYDAWPPTVAFVDPSDWSPAATNTVWFPVLQSTPQWFGLHTAYLYPDGIARPLICFTFTAEYYMVDHSPPEHTVWQQGRHTLSATLTRLAEILSPPYYQRPAA